MKSDQTPQAADQVRPLLTFRDLCKLLNVSQRTGLTMRQQGLIPDPIGLGPRMARWTHDDYLEIVRKLPRRPLQPQPISLAEAKAERSRSIRSAAAKLSRDRANPQTAKSAA